MFESRLSWARGGPSACDESVRGSLRKYRLYMRTDPRNDDPSNRRGAWKTYAPRGPCRHSIRRTCGCGGLSNPRDILKTPRTLRDVSNLHDVWTIPHNHDPLVPQDTEEIPCEACGPSNRHGIGKMTYCHGLASRHGTGKIPRNRDLSSRHAAKILRGGRFPGHYGASRMLGLETSSLPSR